MVNNQDKISGGLRERDRRVLWHPFTQQKLWMKEAFPVIARARGVYLYDVEGKRYLDGVSSLWVNTHGHNRGELNHAIRRQLGLVAHSTFLGLSHQPGIELAEAIIKVAPEGLRRVFFSDNGSTAMEIALKMAYQYWQQKDPPDPARKKFITFTNAYHGDTIGSVSLGGIDLFHAAYRPLLFEALHVPSPYCYRCSEGTELAECTRHGFKCLEKLEGMLSEKQDEIIGVVIEPLMQGAAGMISQPEGFLQAVRSLCNSSGVLMIADEVATGFGRTGRMFACEWEGVRPDIMALGKGITGGYLPLAATLTTENIYEAFLGDMHDERTFFHGHTYTANPLGCAAAIANLEIFKKDKTLENVRARARQLEEGLKDISRLEHVGDVRQKGLMAGIELVKDRVGREPYPATEMMGFQVIRAARRRELIIRPLGDVIILMPPLCISSRQMASLIRITRESIQEATGGRG
jgi:adenosylmethionine-8-amino-7-oxononanoate aminotransferase